ncbi:MAG: C4-type zinc ribbon domain-containing protein [Treponema sp.]|nr:C4-type zinc ribbon domain-containing protein [Treponema sp.]
MATVDTFEKLKELQTILVEKYKLEAKVEEAPKQLSNQEELLADLKKKFIEKNAEYESVKEKVSRLRFELDEAQRARENGEKGMDNITTHREYEALEKQIMEASNKEDEVRKELQKEEKNLEEINESLNGFKSMIDLQENELSKSRQSLNNTLDEYNQELSTLKEKETELSEGIKENEILFKFQRIIQRNAEGIVAVKGGVCTGCHMILPAQFANVVRESEEIMFCPYCSRILFYEELNENDETYSNIDATGSLADFNFEDYIDEDEMDEDERKEFEERKRLEEELGYGDNEADEESEDYDDLDDDSDPMNDDGDDDDSDEDSE